MKREYVSFDVFDTCLIRRCGNPNKIWDLMADRLFEKEDVRGRLSFAGNRSLAEETALMNTAFPTIRDIYNELNVAQWGFKQDDIINLEMEIEEQELFPNPEILKIVNEFREKEYKIAFVSDMYLPTEFIKKILIKHGFCREGENVFVSADCKATKYSGKLFDFVFEKTGTKAKQWIHYGDNERSDYRIPNSKGVKARLVSNTDFTEEEKRWLDNACFYPQKNEIELWAGLCRLTRVQSEKNFATTMAVDFVVSLYVPFVIYVLRTAKAKGIKTLYFLARDSHIFMEIAKSLQKESEGVECRYLKLNRRVLYPSVFYGVDDFELDLTIKKMHYRTVADALKYIGVDYDLLSDSTKKVFTPNFLLNSKVRRKNFAESLKANDAEVLKRSSLEKRGILLAYLKQEGLFDRKSAMVDLGWVGTCRCVTNYILRNEHLNPVPTFYFGYNRNLIYGDAEDLLFVYNRWYDISKKAYAYLFFEEYASISSEKMVIGFMRDGDGIVPIEEDGVSAGPLASLNESVAKRFCEKFNDMKSMTTECFDDIFCLCGLSHFSQILSKPSKQYIDFFGRLEFENYLAVDKAVRRLSLKDIIALFVWGRTPPSSMIWTEAAVKVTFGPFAGMFTRLYGYTSKTAFANRLRLWWENRS